jgi:hypothetical protein
MPIDQALENLHGLVELNDLELIPNASMKGSDVSRHSIEKHQGSNICVEDHSCLRLLNIPTTLYLDQCLIECVIMTFFID